MPVVVLLGPQRLKPTLIQAFEAAKVSGPVAAVTARWEEREDEIDELSERLGPGRPVTDLLLHRRGEDVFRRDSDRLLATGDFVARRRQLRDAYRSRLAHALDAVRDVM